MKQRLIEIFALCFPVLFAAKSETDWLKLDENELYSNLYQAGKGFLPSSLPDGFTEANGETLIQSLQAAKKSESLDQKSNKIRESFREQVRKPMSTVVQDCWTREVFEDHVIVEAGTDGLYRVDYSIDKQGNISFAEKTKWQKVELEYVEASAILPEENFSEENINILASVGKTEKKGGDVWDVTIFKAGFALSNPPVFIDEKAIKASAKFFDNAKVYANENADYYGHKTDRAKKGVKEIVGILKKPYAKGNELHASLHIKPSAQWLKDDLKYFEEQGALDTYQLSVDSGFYQDGKVMSPELKKEVPRVIAVRGGDVDIVPNGAAGGKFNRLVASKSNHINQQGVTKMYKMKLLAAIAFFLPTLLATKTEDEWMQANENDLYSNLLQAGKGFLPSSLPDGFSDQNADTLLKSYQDKFQATSPAVPVKETDKVDLSKELKAAMAPFEKELETLRKQNAENTLRAALDESNLPDATKKHLLGKLSGKSLSKEEIDLEIKTMRAAIADFTNPKIDNLGLDIHAGKDQIEKFQASVDAMFLTSQHGLNPVRKGTDEYKQLFGSMDPFKSINWVYAQLTGDEKVVGYSLKRDRLLASLGSADWVNVISTAMNRRLARDYAALNLETFRAFIEIREGITNFKQQETVRYGGYGNLPIVAERGPYTALTSPTDEKAYWSPAKRGGTEDLSREMIKNDDVSAVQKIPTRMARAAAQTLHEFVYDFINPAVNAAIYDGIALYNAAHLNTGTAALGTDGVALNAARLRMRKQKMKNNLKPLGLRAGYIVGPSDLEEVAYKLLIPAAEKSNDTPAYLQTLGITFIPVEYWSDTTDWVLVARREDIMGLEIGFVDGQETPEIFVSDLPATGSFFTNDVLTYKIRHEYGGAINDWRAFDGSIVA